MPARNLVFLLFTVLALRLVAQPDNDLFSRRIPFEGSDAVLSVLALDATLEPGEPIPRNLPGALLNSVWWTWTAPSDGFVQFGSSQTDVLAAYVGSQLASLSPVVNEGSWFAPFFRVTRGTVYQLSAGALAGTGRERYPWNIGFRFRTPAVNERFAQRIRLGGERAHLSGHNVGVGQLSGDVPGMLGGVWWEWTPAVSGIVSVLDRKPQASLMVFRGSQADQLQPANWPRVKAGEPVQIWASSSGGDVDVELRVSRVAITDPPPDSRLARADPLTVRLSGLPDDVESVTIQAPSLQEWKFVGRPSEVVLTNLWPAYWELVAVATTTNGFVLRSEPVPVIVLSGADAMADAPELSPDGLSVGGWVLGTTLEAGEPPLPSPPSFGGTVWWKWTAPADGYFFWGGGGADGIQIFRGQPDESSQPLVPIPGFYNRLQVEAGQTYLLRLWQTSGLGQWVSTGCGFLPFAKNDDVAHATKLTGKSIALLLAREFCSCEAGEPIPCFEGNGSRWYSWTSPATGKLTLLTKPHWAIPAGLTVFQGAQPQLLELVTQSIHAELKLIVQAGQTYWIRLETRNSLAELVPELMRLSFIPSPPNDSLANGTPLTGTVGTVTGTNDGAGSEDDRDELTRSTWWSWIAPEGGVFQVTALPLPEDQGRPRPRVLFWTAGVGGALQLVKDQIDDWGTNLVSVAGGQEVAVEVFETDPEDPGNPSGYRLDYGFVPRPPNDALGGRTRLVGTRINARGTNWSAAAEEPTDPKLAGSRPTRTIWWEWTAPEDGWLTVQADVPGLALFAGTEPGALTLVANRDSVESLSRALHAQVTRGTTYCLLAGDRPGATQLPHQPDRDGFAVQLQLTRFAIDGLANGQQRLADAPLELRLPSDPEGLNQDFTGVTYFAGSKSGAGLLSNELATVARPAPFQTTVRLPPGVRLLQPAVCGCELALHP